MSWSRSTRSRKQIDNLDRISNLPDNVIDCILSKLPIQDAIDTSLLSKTWQDKWMLSTSSLVFDDLDIHFSGSCDHHYGDDDDDCKYCFTKFVNSALFLHHGPINRFVVRAQTITSRKKLRKWITHLSMKHVEDFQLVLGVTHKDHELPPRFYTFHHLTRLELRNLVMPNLPPDFDGFKSLTTMDLNSVEIASRSLERLIFLCPQLKTLKLIYVSLDYLCINAPKLESFEFIGSFKSAWFESTPSLVMLCVRLYDGVLPEARWVHSTYNRCIDLDQNMEFLSGIHTFDAGMQFLKFLVAASPPKQVPAATLNSLVRLQLSRFKLHDLAAVETALFLIRSSPNLQFLKVSLRRSHGRDNPSSTPVVQFLEEAKCSLSLPKLSQAMLQWFSGTEPEMELLKIILACSPWLQEMAIVPDIPSLKGEGSILKALLCLPRASVLAEIKYSESMTEMRRYHLQF
ncbi:hypothetical protein Tsubulata_015571 [Turnera subulata]|uniref:F-box domain-containing protein n=1 Tax=Turnera subulata TaxID=218843 RepID=A0A9Q0FM28_9ROSI|nr:hypothetical protein Tsubulata_015571 [Turnera subulata]